MDSQNQNYVPDEFTLKCDKCGKDEIKVTCRGEFSTSIKRISYPSCFLCKIQWARMWAVAYDPYPGVRFSS